jgi:hypothetical protein
MVLITNDKELICIVFVCQIPKRFLPVSLPNRLVKVEMAWI